MLQNGGGNIRKRVRRKEKEEEVDKKMENGQMVGRRDTWEGKEK